MTILEYIDHRRARTDDAINEAHRACALVIGCLEDEG